MSSIISIISNYDVTSVTARALGSALPGNDDAQALLPSSIDCTHVPRWPTDGRNRTVRLHEAAYRSARDAVDEGRHPGQRDRGISRGGRESGSSAVSFGSEDSGAKASATAAATLAQIKSFCRAGTRFANLPDRTPSRSRAERVIASTSAAGPSMISITAARACGRVFDVAGKVEKPPSRPSICVSVETEVRQNPVRWFLGLP
jgi:hypothetical protein